MISPKINSNPHPKVTNLRIQKVFGNSGRDQRCIASTMTIWMATLIPLYQVQAVEKRKSFAIFWSLYNWFTDWSGQTSAAQQGLTCYFFHCLIRSYWECGRSIREGQDSRIHLVPVWFPDYRQPFGLPQHSGTHNSFLVRVIKVKLSKNQLS